MYLVYTVVYDCCQHNVKQKFQLQCTGCSKSKPLHICQMHCEVITCMPHYDVTVYCDLVFLNVPFLYIILTFTLCSRIANIVNTTQPLFMASNKIANFRNLWTWFRITNRTETVFINAVFYCTLCVINWVDRLSNTVAYFWFMQSCCICKTFDTHIKVVTKIHK